MYVITGAAGFIGNRLIELLHKDVAHIYAIDLPWFEKDVPKGDNITFIPSDDFRSNVRTGKLPFKTRAVVHLAANNNRFSDDIRAFNDLNFTFPVEILEACNINGANFIYTSDASVYGHNINTTPKPENEDPLDAYSQSRLDFDNFMRSHFRVGTWCLRPFDVYGPKEETKRNQASYLTQMVWQALKYNSIRLYEMDGVEDGEYSHDFISVDEVCDVIMFFLRGRPMMKYGIFNVGRSQSYTFNQAAYDIFSSMDKTVNIGYIKRPEKLISLTKEYRHADISYLRSCGYEKEFQSLYSTMWQLISYYRNNTDKLPIPYRI